MKTLLVLFLFLLSLLSCQDTNRSGKDVSEDMEEPVDTTPKATAIFWVDKDKDYQAKKKDGPLSLRTVKARVEIDSLEKLICWHIPSRKVNASKVTCSIGLKYSV